MDPWPRFMRVGDTATVLVRFHKALAQDGIIPAELVMGEADFELDGQPGWPVTGQGIERIFALGVTPTDKNIGTWNLLARVLDANGCQATTGLKRLVSVSR